MVRNQSTVYLAGPPLLKAATGEIATDEEIGGADMHGQVAGTADYIAENDADGIRIAREIVAALDWNRSMPPPASKEFDERLYPFARLSPVSRTAPNFSTSNPNSTPEQFAAIFPSVATVAG
jgi:geranyl-CoA carboxylase beta subunit